MKRLLLLVGIGLAFAVSGCALDTDEEEDDDSVSETQAEALTTFTAEQRHNLRVINQYRARKGLVALRISPKLSEFARAGSVQLSRDHRPHGHFIDAGASIWRKGFRGSAAENQGDPNGWTRLATDPAENKRKQIDAAQKAMFDEGPGQGPAHGHYNNMMNPKFRRVGIGFRTVNGELYLTNDFSE